MADLKYLVCLHCGNVVEMLHDKGVQVMCCGEPMHALEPNTTDAATEKHIPVVEVEQGAVKVQVGSVPHPMQPEHYIGWIWLQTERGGQRRVLHAGEKPSAEFDLVTGEKPLSVYAWCNLHGLWKKEL